MTLETLRSFLMWCSIINYGLLILWVGLFILTHDPLKKLNDKILGRKIENFDSLHYSGMSLYKIGIILFNIVPWIALTIVR